MPVSAWFKRWLSAAVGCAVIVGAHASSPVYAGGVRVRVHVFEFVDRSRTVDLPGGRRVPRRLETTVRYPSTGRSHPLVVFAHGFALTPERYVALLGAWAAAGYVVAAPVFPLTNANAAGGPREADIVNQPRDMSFVITSLLATNRRPSSFLGGEIDPARIAVAGQSDGGITALAVAYDSRYRDSRVRAAVVLSGARMPGMGSFPAQGPPLLAVQGTADPFNAPATTATYFELAHRPKFLLWLLGASHLQPYTDQEPQLRIVARATTAFLDHYLRGRPLSIFERIGRVPSLTRLIADP